MSEPDFAELPSTYGIDECEILWRTPHSVFVWWELTEAGLAAARRGLGPAGDGARRILRLFLKHPQSGDRHHLDYDLAWNEGQQHLPCNIGNATVRIGVGLLSAEGYFAPIAHSSVIRLPPDRPAEEIAARWVTVAEAADLAAHAGASPRPTLVDAEPDAGWRRGPVGRAAARPRAAGESRVANAPSSTTRPSERQRGEHGR